MQFYIALLQHIFTQYTMIDSAYLKPFPVTFNFVRCVNIISISWSRLQATTKRNWTECLLDIPLVTIIVVYFIAVDDMISLGSMVCDCSFLF